MREHITPKERQRIRNRRRRQEVKRQLYMCGVLVILLIVLVVTYNSKAAEQKKAAADAAKTEQKEQKEQVSADAAKKMEESALGTVADNETLKERIKRVREEARQAGYPEDIQQLPVKPNKTGTHCNQDQIQRAYFPNTSL